MTLPPGQTILMDVTSPSRKKTSLEGKNKIQNDWESGAVKKQEELNVVRIRRNYKKTGLTIVVTCSKDDKL